MGLKNYEYNKILREYDMKQFRSRHDLESRKKALYEEIPELKDLDDEIVTNSVQSAKLAIMGDDAAIDRLKRANLDLAMRKTELLLSHGYNAQYLSPHFECPNCQDTGYIGNEKCHCFKQAVVDIVYAQSNIKNVLEKENFNSFSLDYYSDIDIDSTSGITPRANAKRVYSLAKQFTELFDKFDSPCRNLLLYGNSGVGKTFLSNCIAKELLDLGHTVIYLTSFQLFDILTRQAFQKDEEGDEADKQLEYILDCDLLIIDDLGTELSNSFTNTKLFLVINERHLRSKSTLISTNLSLDSLKANYSERIYSRITSNYVCLKLFGDDIRYKKRFLKN